MRTLCFIFFLMLIAETGLYSQPCCGAIAGGMGTAGARMGLGTAAPGNFQMQFAYDFNYMDRLYDGTVRLENNDLIRVIHTGVLEVNYGISRRLSVAAMGAYTGQEIGSRRIDGSRQVDYIWGFGDIILMAKYRLMNPLAWSGWEVAAGIGPKLPTGSYRLAGSEGEEFGMEIQPGTGSFDGISWLSISKTHLFIPNLNLRSGVTFRYAGKNTGYQGSRVYDFGNEIQASAGLSYSFYAGINWDLFGFTRYRYQGTDMLDGDRVETIGGQWLFASPGIGAAVTPNLSLMVLADMPLYHDIKGPQLTSSFRVSAGIVYNISARQTVTLANH
ncbi:MAG: transporter [Marinilabiliales bacterium]|nr:MAG: transporter [Marinilabiliales bacterium]